MADLTRDNPVEKKSCPRCGASFECGAKSGAGCWCSVLPRLIFVDPALGDCLCPDCLKAALTVQEQAPASE
ncbi:MAG TPA: cysteine-rich CWC family protein [Rhodocyclaceae bacterium]|nr:cysteine-rich CWC family protein [Rhodocyclaceae bacterium]